MDFESKIKGIGKGLGLEPSNEAATRFRIDDNTHLYIYHNTIQGRFEIGLGHTLGHENFYGELFKPVKVADSRDLDLLIREVKRRTLDSIDFRIFVTAVARDAERLAQSNRVAISIAEDIEALSKVYKGYGLKICEDSGHVTIKSKRLKFETLVNSMNLIEMGAYDE